MGAPRSRSASPSSCLDEPAYFESYACYLQCIVENDAALYASVCAYDPLGAQTLGCAQTSCGPGVCP